MAAPWVLYLDGSYASLYHWCETQCLNKLRNRWNVKKDEKNDCLYPQENFNRTNAQKLNVAPAKVDAAASTSAAPEPSSSSPQSSSTGAKTGKLVCRHCNRNISTRPEAVEVKVCSVKRHLPAHRQILHVIFKSSFSLSLSWPPFFNCLLVNICFTLP